MEFINKLNISGISRALLYVLIFFQPFNHFNSFREVSFYCLLLLFLVKLARKEAKIALSDKTAAAVFLLFGWSLLVSAAGPFPAESLNALRKNLFREAVILLFVIAEFRSLNDLKKLFWVIVSSFAAVTCASIIENIMNDWELFSSFTPSVSWRSVSTYFFANYADNGMFYLPFTAAWLVSIKEVTWKKWTGAGILTAGTVLVYIYNARTQLLTVFCAYIIIMLLARRFKLLAVFITAAALCISIVFAVKPDALSRYKTLVDVKTYTTDQGLTNRLGLWRVVVDIIEERPLAGYGYGWKKLAWIIQEKDSDEFWGEYPSSARAYYVDDAQLMYGRVSPHNLPLQMIFEIGLTGFLIYLWLWGTVLWKIAEIGRHGGSLEGRRFIISGTGIIAAFVMVNVTNSMWQENYGMMIFLFMAVAAVIHRESETAIKNSELRMNSSN